MLNNIKNISLIAALFVSSSAIASVTTADFHSNNITGESSSAFNQFSLTVDGIDINVSAWSDTKNSSSNGINANGNDNDADPFIERAYDLDPNRNGWSMINQDERNTRNCGYSHSADNLANNNCNYQDYDFFLLEFSAAVALSEAFYSWAYGQNNSTDGDVVASRNQVSVAAISSDSAGSIDGNTWGNIGSDTTTTSNYSQLYHDGNYSHHYYSNIGVVGEGNANNLAGVYSNFWLIGALNASAFGGETDWEGNDGMKLAGVKFTTSQQLPATSVPEPSTIALFGLAIVGLFASSRKKLK
ncbi:exosortase-dependent surface protein XDP1 [Cognaticolwellia beringensis]|uniref:PEP-CTERM sorting domain-containing protein n=1 Tax=Cognaticolwellia beringensis TaxID=1967665 RepID=A0A222G622_9GAMM|nr:exosortase-dependent surface protein XDP1 [Cognaticolwellia beringensis]ASP47299.1 PEP-CTERM sorting domain-containing protein [Cognaticolwellia beringensis]